MKLKIEKKYLYVGGAVVGIGALLLFFLRGKGDNCTSANPGDDCAKKHGCKDNQRWDGTKCIDHNATVITPGNLNTQSGDCGYAASGEKLIPVDMGGQVKCMTAAEARNYIPSEEAFPPGTGSGGLDCSAYPGTVPTDMGSGTMRCAPVVTVTPAEEQYPIASGPGMMDCSKYPNTVAMDMGSGNIRCVPASMANPPSLENQQPATTGLVKGDDGRGCASYGAYHLQDDGSGNMVCYPDAVINPPLNPYYATPTLMCPPGYHQEGLDSNAKCVADYAVGTGPSSATLDFDVCGSNRQYSETFRRATGIDPPCPYDILAWELKQGHPVKWSGKTYNSLAELEMDSNKLRQPWSVWQYTATGNCTMKYIGS